MGKQFKKKGITEQTQGQEYSNNVSEYLNQQIFLKQLKKKIAKKSNANVLSSIKKEKFNRIISNKQLSKVCSPQMLECAICLELMVLPHMLACGHMFCYRCLEMNTVHNQTCCLCRQQQANYQSVPSHLAEKLIYEYLRSNISEYLKYLCRVTDAVEWIKRRTVINFKIGEFVDFKDYHTWRKGVIIRNQINEKHKNIVQIKILVKGQAFFEEMEITSKKIASYTFFTKEKYLQEFSPSLFETQDVEQLYQHKCKQEHEDDFLGSYTSTLDVMNHQEQTAINSDQSVCLQVNEPQYLLEYGINHTDFLFF